ncbi:hypothetical protein [Shewanella sp.]|jgi:hypothetical protein|uniref:hypothetical protein n=1 Tax=Shewanella sp. TaxID=50422 RepID=UPI00404846A9
MLKLNKANPTQTLAIYLDTTASIQELPALVLQYSQSYDLSNGNIEMEVDSIKGQYYIGTISGSQIPSPSGQYDINVYSGSFEDAIWSQVAIAWNAYNETWSSAGIYQPSGDLLRTIRAWVSGSNDSVFTNYVSPNELGTYTTYNG